MKIELNKVPAALAVVCIVIGVMLAMQYRTNLHSPSYVSYREWSRQLAQGKDLQQQNDALLKETMALRAELAGAASGKQNQSLKKQLKQADVLAGFTLVAGPGLVIILDDNSDPMQQNDQPEDHLIHDASLLLVINQLRNAGAEAISVNSERIIACSEVRCAGPTILVNLKRLTPPYEIRAIGDTDRLEQAMRREGGDLENLRFSGIKVSVQTDKNLEIPAYHGILQYQYARNK